MLRIGVGGLAALILASCTSERLMVPSVGSPDGVFAALPQDRSDEYRIGAGDLLRVQVLQVPELSADNLRVDPNGNIQLPLLGGVQIAGMTAPALAENVRAELQARYLQDPRVSVVVLEAADQKITIDGAVAKPGVYEMKGRTTLMQAVAMAEGTSRTANLKQVVVFRTHLGERSVAIFDLRAIRRGEAMDPVLLGDDIVVVDSSRLSAAFRDIVQALPALAIFRSY